MKVSEAIDRLKVGDTVWVKGEVEYITKLGALPLALEFAETTKYFAEKDEISLTEPTKKVEIPMYVAEWIVFCKNKDYSLHTAMNRCRDVPDVIADIYQDFRDWSTCEEFQENEEIFARAWLDGFTVEPKRWVVKIGDYHSTYIESLTVVPKLRYTLSEQEGAYKFTNHERAEAVATLVEGSVEEV